VTPKRLMLNENTSAVKFLKNPRSSLKKRYMPVKSPI
jgi:hypothetical protein